MTKEMAIRKLMQDCQSDPELYANFVANPKQIGEKYKITFEPEELQQIERVAKLHELLQDFDNGRIIGPPIGYPVDVMLKGVINDYISKRPTAYYRIPTGYPAPRHFYGVYPVVNFPWYRYGGGYPVVNLPRYRYSVIPRYRFSRYRIPRYIVPRYVRYAGPGYPANWGTINPAQRFTGLRLPKVLPKKQR